MTENADADNLQLLFKHLAIVDHWSDLIEQQAAAWVVQDRSALSGDDAKTDPYHVSHAAWNALTVAVDHLRCLKNSLHGESNLETQQVLLHTHAQASLVRGAIENAARVVWLIGPLKRSTRIHRRLILEFMETKSAYSLRELMGPADPTVKDSKLAKLNSLAISSGASNSNLKAVLYGDILEEAGSLAQFTDNEAQVVWKICSSLAHGDLSGTLGALDKQTVSRNGSTYVLRMTVPVQLLLFLTIGAIQMLEHGFRLYEQRRTSHL